MHRKVLAPALLLGALVAGGMGYQGGAAAHMAGGSHLSARAQAMKTYSDTKLGFKLQYPSTWQLQTGRKTTNMGKIESGLAPTAVELGSPDGLAVGAVLVHAGATSTATIKSTEKALLLEQDKPLSKLNYSVKSINGLSYPWSEMQIQGTGGLQADAFVAATSHGGHTYYFLGAVVTNAKKESTSIANTHINEIAGIVSSLTIM